MLGRTVMKKSVDIDDGIYPFRKVAETLRSVDIVFVNLESPIVNSCPLHESGYVFCASSLMVEGLVSAGVDVVNIANNHSKNYGQKGIKDTLEILGDKEILVTGLGELVTVQRGSTKFGFLGFDKSQQINPKLEKNEADLVKSSDIKVDILVVSMHWGVEYQDKALPGVRNLANELIGYGADLIVGHHPHWVQDYELIEGKPVYYSLGNFIFDQMWSEKTRKGLAVVLVYEKGLLTNYNFLPTYMSSWAQPEFVELY